MPLLSWGPHGSHCNLEEWPLSLEMAGLGVSTLHESPKLSALSLPMDRWLLLTVCESLGSCAPPLCRWFSMLT